MSRTGWGLTVAAAVLVLLGSITGMRELAVIGVGAALAVLVGLLLGRRRPTLTVQRDVDPPRATVGDVALARVTLCNVGTRPVAAVTFDERVDGQPISLAFKRLEPERTRSATYHLPTDRRAVVQIGPGSVSSGDPFGVVDGVIELGGSTEFIVHPRRHAITSYPRASRRSVDGPEAQKAALGSMVFHALREYVPGDDLRHVHWKSSARTGSLMVRQYVDTDMPELTVLLDLDLSVYDDGAFESACEAAASVIEGFQLRGYAARLMTSVGASTMAVTGTVQLLDLIAGLQPLADTDFAGALSAAGARPNGVGLVVITGRAAPDVVAQAVGLSGPERVVVLAEVRADVATGTRTSRGDLQRIQARNGEDFARSWNETVRW